METTKTISKRLLAIIMSLAMVFSLVGANIFSASAETSGDYEYKTLADGTVEITGYTGSAKDITIPSTLDGKTVTSIGEETFYGCDLTSVVIPGSVESIGKEAFLDCYSLENVTIGNGVKSIGDDAFKNCHSLKSITLPNSVESIGEKAFLSCKSLKSVTLEKGVKSIGNSAFNDCDSLKSIKIPDSVESIGKFAFSACKSMKSIDVKEKNANYSSLNGVLFNKNKTILIEFPSAKKDSSYTIPNGVKTISARAFDNCKLKSITLPNSLKSIGKCAFELCKSLKSVTIPKSVTRIEKSAFYGCNALKKITYNGKFSGLKKITVENSNKAFRKAPIYYVANKTTKKHTHTIKVKNKKAATYFEKGYTGDRACKACGMIAEKGKATAKKTPGDKIKVAISGNQIKIKYTKVSGATGFGVKVVHDSDNPPYETYKYNYNTKKSVTKTIKDIRGEYYVYVYVYKKSGGKTVYSNKYCYYKTYD